MMSTVHPSDSHLFFVLYGTVYWYTSELLIQPPLSRDR